MSEQKSTYGAGSGGSQLYAIEARLTYSDARKIAGTILTKEWRRVHFTTAPIGVPNFPLHPLRNDYLGLFTYEAAIALAHWFLTCPDEDTEYPYHPTGVEARLVQVKLTYSYSTEELGVGKPINHADMQTADKWEKRS